MAARVSQEGLLAITQGTPKDRISQVGLLAITSAIPLSTITAGARIIRGNIK